jgi:hypothetical protein
MRLPKVRTPRLRPPAGSPPSLADFASNVASLSEDHRNSRIFPLPLSPTMSRLTPAGIRREGDIINCNNRVAPRSELLPNAFRLYQRLGAIQDISHAEEHLASH